MNFLSVVVKCQEVEVNFVKKADVSHEHFEELASKYETRCLCGQPYRLLGVYVVGDEEDG